MQGTWERRPDGGQMRVIRDRDRGRAWRVWQTDARKVPGAPRPECLIFDGSDVVRRAWRVPDDWRALPDDELLRLMEGG